MGTRGDRNLVIPLLEQNGSGYRGVAFLHADGDRTTVFVTLFDSGSGTTVAPAPDASIAPPASPIAAPVASPAAASAAP